MEKIYYQTLKETLFHEKLENGLEVYLLPKIGFEKTYGLFSTRFGSIDTTFVPLGQKEMIKVEEVNSWLRMTCALASRRTSTTICIPSREEWS